MRSNASYRVGFPHPWELLSSTYGCMYFSPTPNVLCYQGWCCSLCHPHSAQKGNVSHKESESWWGWTVPVEEPPQFQTRVEIAWGAGRGLYPHVCLQHQVQAQDYLRLLCSWLHVSLEFNSNSQGFGRWLNCHRQGKPLCGEQSTAKYAKMARDCMLKQRRQVQGGHLICPWRQAVVPAQLHRAKKWAKDGLAPPKSWRQQNPLHWRLWIDPNSCPNSPSNPGCDLPDKNSPCRDCSLFLQSHFWQAWILISLIWGFLKLVVHLDAFKSGEVQWILH